MKGFVRVSIASLIKLKRLKLYTIHIVLPLLIAGVFLLYYSFASWSPIGKTEAYFQVLGIGMPILIGLFCEMLSEQEAAAGNYQNLLMRPDRRQGFFGLLSVLVVEGGLALLVAGSVFGVGNCLILQQSPIAFISYVNYSVLMLLCNLVSYVIHLFLALQCKKGVSSITGIAESLLAALLLTGLGDRIWWLVPCAWGPRLGSQILVHKFDTNCILAIGLCGIMTVVATIAFSLWAARFEGKAGNA